MTNMYLPHVHVSYAQSLDARIATGTGDSRYISGPESLTLAHRYRAEYDAILVGIGTVLIDDPMLNCRLPEGCPSQPVRVVLDRKLRIPLTSKIAATAKDQTTLVVCSAGEMETEHARALESMGLGLLACEYDDQGFVLKSVLEALTRRDIGSVFVEGGSAVLTSFFKQNLVDTFTLVIAPMLIGSGKDAIGDLGVDKLLQAKRFETLSVELCGKDLAWHMKRST